MDFKTLELFFELDGKKNISDIFKKTDIDIKEIKKRLSKLLNYKLIELKTYSHMLHSDITFFKQLESHLALTIGSVSGKLIQEAVTNMGYTIKNFPQERHFSLISELSLHIPDLTKRTKFSYAMLEILGDASNIKHHEQELKGRTITQKPLGIGITNILPGLGATLSLAFLSIWISKIIGINILGFEKSPISPVMVAGNVRASYCSSLYWKCTILYNTFK